MIRVTVGDQIKRKHVVVDFVLEVSNKTKSSKIFISYVAFGIYKHNMLFRLDFLSETAYNCVTML